MVRREKTDLVRLALLVMVNDEAEFTSSVLLTVLEVAINLQFVSLCIYKSVIVKGRGITYPLPPSTSSPTLVMCLGFALVLPL